MKQNVSDRVRAAQAESWKTERTGALRFGASGPEAAPVERGPPSGGTGTQAFA